MEEVWRDIPGFEGKYQANNYGNIRSLKFKNTNRLKILTPKRRGNYLAVKLTKGKTSKMYSIHRLVYQAFNGPIPEGMQVNHIDENRYNNSLDNLNLMSPKANINWGSRNERASKSQVNGKNAKRVRQMDLDGNVIKEYPSAMEIERELGFNRANISSCCRHQKNYNTAYGFRWEYI